MIWMRFIVVKIGKMTTKIQNVMIDKIFFFFTIFIMLKVEFASYPEHLNGIKYSVYIKQT